MPKWKHDLQKCCKVCKNAKSIVTTMGSQRFGVSKTQYVCNFFCVFALTLDSQRFQFPEKQYLTALLGGHFSILAYLTWFLRGRFLYFAKVPLCTADIGVFKIACFAKVSLCTADHGVLKKGDVCSGEPLGSKTNFGDASWTQDGSR